LLLLLRFRAGGYFARVRVIARFQPLWRALSFDFVDTVVANQITSVSLNVILDL